VALAALALLLQLSVPQFDWVLLQQQPALRAALVLGLVGAGAALYLGVLLALGLRPGQFARRTAS
jgi:putative peptidoglycan lipid II flippase